MVGVIRRPVRLMRFEDRRHAGAELASEVARLEPADPVVLALPRGGAPVGFEVADLLDCPLDVLLVRKIGVPSQPELAMGAVAEGGVVVRNDEMVALARVDEAAFQAVLSREEGTLAKQAALFRPGLPPVDPVGRTALVVDDGLATGATALAAVDALRRRKAAAVWVCVPVAPADTAAAMADVADRVVVVHQPRHFGAVGAWYRDFAQVEDDEVRAFLSEARLRWRPPSEEDH